MTKIVYPKPGFSKRCPGFYRPTSAAVIAARIEAKRLVQSA